MFTNKYKKLYQDSKKELNDFKEGSSVLMTAMFNTLTGRDSRVRNDASYINGVVNVLGLILSDESAIKELAHNDDLKNSRVNIAFERELVNFKDLVHEEHVNR